MNLSNSSDKCAVIISDDNCGLWYRFDQWSSDLCVIIRGELIYCSATDYYNPIPVISSVTWWSNCSDNIIIIIINLHERNIPVIWIYANKSAFRKHKITSSWPSTRRHHPHRHILLDHHHHHHHHHIPETIVYNKLQINKIAQQLNVFSKWIPL